tara:strand:- start:82 stop:195 length:114 start_codon:yes stop_codon:yes gene_type:complete
MKQVEDGSSSEYVIKREKRTCRKIYINKVGRTEEKYP